MKEDQSHVRRHRHRPTRPRRPGPAADRFGRAARSAREGHPLYCQALEDVRTHTRAQAADWTDEQLAEHATAEGVAAAPGASREVILADLVFARFDATPAALAYQALAERAHAHHAGLID